MSTILPPVLKRLYRKEPISSFLIVVGAVDAVLGGVNEIGTLMILGLLTSGVSLGYRWWCIQQAETKLDFKSKQQRYLAPSASSNPLPNLDRRDRREQ